MEVELGEPVVVAAVVCSVLVVTVVLVDAVLRADVLLAVMVELVEADTLDSFAIHSCLDILRGVFESEQCNSMAL